MHLSLNASDSGLALSNRYLRIVLIKHSPPPQAPSRHGFLLSSAWKHLRQVITSNNIAFLWYLCDYISQDALLLQRLHAMTAKPKLDSRSQYTST